VLAQAERFARRVREQADEPAAQVDLAYRIALARTPTPQESAIGTDLIAKQSLTAFTHVVVNLDEFLYVR
jgi:hypothetical protein